MTGYYKSRATQLRAFASECRAGKQTLFDSLKNAAMVGAYEERSRALEFIRKGMTPQQIAEAITATPIMQVLGFKPKR